MFFCCDFCFTSLEFCFAGFGVFFWNYSSCFFEVANFCIENYGCFECAEPTEHLKTLLESSMSLSLELSLSSKKTNHCWIETLTLVILPVIPGQCWKNTVWIQIHLRSQSFHHIMPNREGPPLLNIQGNEAFIR